mmetsp:Transcript_34096/g.105336  ORF Transcript_34096/g.105336 Transcript_34096/m.105336 type:complete len:535 (-) Transcript_34096:236-1840(-)|eukprot:CAMPEP_0174852528 /NCGR_PEP_ID=MMETSP1114-20130205/25707_1 /TAXON_ID=312471 /ORGANISM="Neobodo designis, Strain CCAP 1951/1" /LENGTH=534 /DNA_ID=CAMNT_0016087129 /DNA_START=414 /DNA_END=2018 /DNA_ORIENTATION=+
MSIHAANGTTEPPLYLQVPAYTATYADGTDDGGVTEGPDSGLTPHDEPIRLGIDTAWDAADDDDTDTDDMRRLAGSPVVVPAGSCFVTPQGFGVASVPGSPSTVSCRRFPLAHNSPEMALNDAPVAELDDDSAAADMAEDESSLLPQAASFIATPGTARGASGSVEIGNVDVTDVAVAVKSIALVDDFRRRSAANEIAFAERAALVLERSEASSENVDETPLLWRRVAQVHGVAIDADVQQCTVVTEALHGGTLADAVADRPLDSTSPTPQALAPDGLAAAPTSDAAAGVGTESESAAARKFGSALKVVARELLEGLMMLHGDMRVLHNDLKLDNVMLVSPPGAQCACLAGLRSDSSTTGPPQTPQRCEVEAHIKIIDFGSSAVLPIEPEDNHGDSGEMQLPQQGALSTMAPERLRADAYGTKADVWSAGAMLLQLARGGRHPFLSPAPAFVAQQRASADANNTKFWRLAAATGCIDGGEQCEATSRSAVTAALNDCALGRHDDEFRSFVRWALQADPTKRASAAELLQDPWLQ